MEESLLICNRKQTLTKAWIDELESMITVYAHDRNACHFQSCCPFFVNEEDSRFHEIHISQERPTTIG